MSGVTTGTVLDRIVARTREDLAERKRDVPLAALRERIGEQAPPVDVPGGLRREHVAVIAEFKRASPSRGRFPIQVEPATVAREYIAGGAAAISCLTDAPFFEGSPADLERVVDVARVAEPPVGVLRKDFIVDPYQVEEARGWGASCVLLIVAALDDVPLGDLHAQATALGMSCLVEVHDEGELERALGIGASLLGVNNRDLRTLAVDLAVTERLGALAPPEVVLVGESGISSAADVERMACAGVDAVLIGESIITQPDRRGAVAGLAHTPRRDRHVS